MLRYMFVATLIVLTLAACGGRPSETVGAADPAATQEETAPLAVEVVKVARGALITNVEATGAVQGVAEAFVVSETQGIVKSVLFELGDLVEMDQILATVDDTVARLGMEEAAQQAETTRLELESTQKLAKQGNASRASLTRAEAAANGAGARYEAAVKAYRDTSVRAPISGAVASKESGAALGNLLTPGTPVARIVDLSAVRIEVAVGEAEVGLMESGLEAQLQVPAACGDVIHTGVVQAVAAGADPRTGSYTVVISASNPCPGRIRSGMTVFVSILTDQRSEALLMPVSALVKGPRGDSVYAVTDNQVRQIPVRLGRTVGDVAELLEGPEAGTLIAVSGLPSLRQGMRVQATTVEVAGISP